MKRISKMLFILFLIIVSNTVKAEPANDTFLDDNLYKCVIDAYNIGKEEKKEYTYSILPEELIEIKSLDCSKYAGSIDNLTGLDKMVGLTSINLSNNIFLGGSISINEGENATLTSSIKLPSSLSFIDKVYTISDNSIVSINNNVITGLKDGSTYITMTAKVSGNEIQEKYLVSVKSTTPKSSIATLKSLSLSSGEFNFKSNVNKYTAIVSKSVSSVSISAVLQSAKASFVSDFGPRKVNLKVGNNTAYIKVKAEDGTLNTYTLNIVRSDGSDSNNFLANIELSTGKINFSRDVLIYTFNVASNVDEILVRAVPESTLANVKVSDTKIKTGENKITITVLAENQSEKKYELIVTKEEYESEKNYLKELIIKGYDIDFSKDKSEYNINVKGESSLKIIATPERSSSAVSITGNKNLANDSIVKIIVSDEDNVKRIYNIKINKSFFYDLDYKYILLFMEFIVIIILILIIIFRPKRKSRKKVKGKMNFSTMNKVCKKCGAINDYQNTTCYVCGKELK